jgi:hypothetical protein
VHQQLSQPLGQVVRYRLAADQDPVEDRPGPDVEQQFDVDIGRQVTAGDRLPEHLAGCGPPRPQELGMEGLEQFRVAVEVGRQ